MIARLMEMLVAAYGKRISEKTLKELLKKMMKSLELLLKIVVL